MPFKMDVRGDRWGNVPLDVSLDGNFWLIGPRDFAEGDDRKATVANIKEAAAARGLELEIAEFGDDSVIFRSGTSLPEPKAKPKPKAAKKRAKAK